MKTAERFPHSAAENVAYGLEGYQSIDQKIAQLRPSKVVVCCDQNTAQWVPFVLKQLPALTSQVAQFTIPAGEQHKVLETAVRFWQYLQECGADRNTLLLSIGGGVVTDLGAFVASTYLRGIDFCAIPTSLLAMVDASVGGKTGINFGTYKNQIGTFSKPLAVAIDPHLLSTLPDQEWTSGHGEMVKHALLAGEPYWPEVLGLHRSNLGWEAIAKSVEVKASVVQADFREQGARKQLNLGHTFGHALESVALHGGMPIPHGAAVVQGLHVALHLSEQHDLRDALAARYPWRGVHPAQLEALWRAQLGDKKNQHGQVQFVLLDALGRASWNHPITRAQWEDALLELNEDLDPCRRF